MDSEGRIAIVVHYLVAKEEPLLFHLKFLLVPIIKTQNANAELYKYMMII